jgi:hypothetical protein
MKLILDQCEVKEKAKDSGMFVAEIFHHKVNENGGCNITPIGHLIASNEKGDDTFLKHTAIQLFLRSDVRYIFNKKETIVVVNPERQAGPNINMLRNLLKIKEDIKCYYHPQLPNAIVDYLLANDICKEPIGVNICSYIYHGFIERGQLWCDD